MPQTTAIDELLRLFDLHDFTHSQGFCPTKSEQVLLFRATEYQRMAPLMYERGVVVILQGSKVGYINEVRLEYGPENYLIVTAPFPIRCETFASPEDPLMGLLIRLDQSLISPLLDKVTAFEGPDFFNANREIMGVDVATMTTPFLSAVTRLLEALRKDLDTAVLLPHILTEIMYTIMLGEQRHILAAFARDDSLLSRINRVMVYLHQNPASKASMTSLAQMAGMSTSVFHRAFKQTVRETPLQYLKKVRLNKAKSLIIHGGRSASAAAMEVGYESAPQFSREFKRYFGLPPSKADQLGYQNFLAGNEQHRRL